MTKIAFFKSKYGDCCDKTIDFWTGKLGYSHCAIVEKEDDFYYHLIEAMQGYGVRRRRIAKQNMAWDFVLVRRDKDTVISKAKSQLGKRYDWLGLVLNWIVPIQMFFKSDLDDGKKWWCSELVAYALDIKPDNVSPNRLYKMLKGK